MFELIYGLMLKLFLSSLKLEERNEILNALNTLFRMHYFLVKNI